MSSTGKRDQDVYEINTAVSTFLEERERESKNKTELF
jgi:hypothetical protein